MPLMAHTLIHRVVDTHRTVLHGAQPPAEPEDHAPRLLHEDAERAVVDLQGPSQTSLPQPRGDDHAPWYVSVRACACCVRHKHAPGPAVVLFSRRLWTVLYIFHIHVGYMYV